MERFTEKFENGRNILRKGIADIFRTGFGRFFEGDAIDKLAEYEHLEEQGLLLKLPCEVGHTVYVIELDEENFTIIHRPLRIAEYEFELGMYPLIGKCIFLTQAEAEEALKGMGEK